MARKTLGEKVEDLERFTTTLEFRIQNLNDTLAKVSSQQDELIRSFNDLRREHESDLKLLKHQLEELRKDRERGGQRIWAILTALIAGVLGALLINFLGIKK